MRVGKNCEAFRYFSFPEFQSLGLKVSFFKEAFNAGIRKFHPCNLAAECNKHYECFYWLSVSSLTSCGLVMLNIKH